MKRLLLTITFGLLTVFLLVPAPVDGSSPRLAKPGYSWSFPDDHGSHPEYGTEWWYFTGVVDGERHEFGYQFTIFRSRTDGVPRRGSEWFTNQVFLGHGALSDLQNRTHRTGIRIARGHPRLAGADTTMPGSIFLRDWSLSIGDTWTIRARFGDRRMTLHLKPTRLPLFQGPGGYSRKGPDTGQASQYYSYTRMKTDGTIRVGGNTVPVNGRTWFDHEFGSSQLSDSQEGWDWISLRLSNGSDLMVYRLRETDGGVTPKSSATLRRPDGTVRYLSADEWTMEPLEHWRSSKTGGRYPVRWQLTAEDPELDLVIDRRFDAQEMVLKQALNPPYWEGVISADGTLSGRAVSGEGFLEMTGYVQSLEGTF